MKYNLTKLNPFKTDIEVKEWMDKNCKLCKSYDCRVKRTFRETEVMSVTEKQAEWMGVTEGKILYRCSKFIEVVPTRKLKDVVDNFIDNSF